VWRCKCDHILCCDYLWSQK